MRIFSDIGIFSPVPRIWSYQHSGMSFGTQRTFSEHWVHTPTPLGEIIEFWKKNFFFVEMGLTGGSVEASKGILYKTCKKRENP